MTFGELAAIRGISKLSAVALVRRRGWRRQRDNKGHMTALIPAGWADSEPTDQGEDQAATRLLAGAVVALEWTVTSLTAAGRGGGEGQGG